MATRLYFSKIAPNVILHDLAKGMWAGGGYIARPDHAAHWVWRLTPTKSAAGAKFSPTCKTNQQGDFDALFMEWMTYPLDAQTIGGTIDLCAMVFAQWSTNLGVSADSIVRFKLHVYIAEGQSRTVRHTLLDNYVDATDLWNPNTSVSLRWQSLTAPQALTSGDAQAGDVVVVEFGLRVVSSPTPAPTYPPSDFTTVPLFMIGAVAAQADATPGSTNSALTAWLEFSQTLTFQAAPAAPSNELCVNAIAIPSLPYDSGVIDTSAATGTQRETFWSLTAPTTGRMIVYTLGGNYATNIDLLATCGGGFPAGVTSLVGTNEIAAHRSQGCFVFDVTAGASFIIRISNVAATFNATNGGGAVRLRACYVSAPAVDDLYLPSGAIAAFREGALVNINPTFEDFFPTGVAIDYTQRPMADLNGGTSTAVRLLVGLFSFDLVEILDITTLNVGEDEIDFIGDGWGVSGIPGPAQLYVTEAGLLYAGWWGNGFLYVLGIGASTPSLMNTISDDPDFSAIKVIDATHGDNQAGAPFTAARLLPEVDDTAAWAFTLDELASEAYYTSTGLYVPLGGQTVQRFNVSTEAQLADLVTLPSGGGYNPGVKGLTLLSDRSVLICNATRVVRVSSAGAILATYIPSVPLDSRTLIDVKVTQDEGHFWVVDLDSTALFKFDLATGLEVGYYPTYLRPGTLVQMALYNPAGLPPPPPPPVTLTACPPQNWLRPAASGCVAIGELPDNA